MRTSTITRKRLVLAARIAIAAAVLAVVVLGLGLPDDDTASAATTTVNVGQRANNSAGDEFNANTISITAGDTAHWVWFSGTHNVTPFNTAEAWGTTLTYFDGTAPDTWDVSFNTPGTTWYLCTLHANRGDIDTNGDGSVTGADTPNFGKMIGRIDVQAAPQDTTGPTSSGLAAVPNPTNGASSVALSATVTDTGTPVSNIAAAEYFVDAVGVNGSGTAMAATDGVFNATTEGVQTNLNAGALALGDHTVYVHGRDAAGNWGPTASLVLTVSAPPAGAETAIISVLGGTLSLDTNPVDFGAIGLTGVDQTVDTAPLPWFASDARGTGSGWNATVSSTDFTSTGGTITVDNFKLRQLAANINTVAGNTAPVSQVTTYQPLAALPLEVLSAALNTGMGTYDFTPDFRLGVPAETVPGDYQAFMTVSINSGP